LGRVALQFDKFRIDSCQPRSKRCGKVSAKDRQIAVPLGFLTRDVKNCDLKFVGLGEHSHALSGAQAPLRIINREQQLLQRQHYLNLSYIREGNFITKTAIFSSRGLATIAPLAPSHSGRTRACDGLVAESAHRSLDMRHFGAFDWTERSGACGKPDMYGRERALY
jgi:hypothetical protein